jgi:pimeloyl-ACP methyl ester carboxylesterase
MPSDLMSDWSRQNTQRIEVGPVADHRALSLAVDLMLPQKACPAPKLLVCLPGGGVNRCYFDMRDGDDDRFSFARAMTAAGHVVAMIDPPGAGDSDTIEDPFQLTVATQMPLLARAVEEVRRQGFGKLPAIGVGHSAGGMLTGALQAHSRCFDAVALLCFGAGGLPQHLPGKWLDAAAANRDAAYEAIPDFARAHYRRPTFETQFREGDSAASRALQAVRTPTLAAVSLQVMTPANIARELAEIEVPVFTALGERDMLGPPSLLGQAYAACPDFTQVVVAGAGHHIFLVDNAQQLFARFTSWLESIDPLR